MANKKHSQYLVQGIDVWNSWREAYPDIYPDLSNIKQDALNFEGVNFERVNLSGVAFPGSSFNNVNLSESDLRGAILPRASFSGANLQGANLTAANLQGADLTEADIVGANLTKTDLRGANFDRTKLGLISKIQIFAGADGLPSSNLNSYVNCQTIFSDTNLKGAINLDKCEHVSNSNLDIDTLKLSGILPRKFLKGCGFPEELLRNSDFFQSIWKTGVPLTEEDACDAMGYISRQTFARLQKQPSLGEETLTDWLLISTSELIQDIKYFKFNKYQEARETGADWDWWFISNRKVLGIRVQAKKISDKRNNYAKIAHTNRNGLQIDTLIENSKKHNMIPVYVFYYPLHQNKSDDFHQGIHIAGAHNLYQSYIKQPLSRIRSNELITKTTPITSIVCPTKQKIINTRSPVSSNDTVSDPVIKIHERLLKILHSENILSRNVTASLGIHDHPPDLIMHLLESDITELPKEAITDLESYTTAIQIWDYRNK